MLTALTQVLIRVLHRFISTTLAQHCLVLQLHVPLHCIVYSCCAICTWCLAATHTTSLVVHLLYMPIYACLEHCSLLASAFPECCGSVCLSPCLGRDWHKGKSGGLTSGLSWVTMLLGAAAFCYIILEMMHASIWPETHEYDLPPNMLHLYIYDCACLWKIVLLYFLIDSSMLMSPTFCVFLYFTIQDWLMIQFIAGMKTVMKCPCPYSEIVSPLCH
jgi:hypothetical protein